METATDRQERISWWRQDCLNSASVAVIGAGALGNEALKNLALMGLGTIHVFDFDRVETTNLSRTILFGPSDVGKSKAVTAASRAKELNVNPNAVIVGHHLDVVWELGAGLLRRMNIVLGCLDNLEARQSIGNACYQLAIPYIDGGMSELGGRVQLHLTNHGGCMGCTIGDSERLAMRNRYSCLNVMKSSFAQGIVPTTQITSSFVAALMCQEAIKYLQGKAVPFGSVISWGGDKNDFDVLRIPKAAACPTCGLPPIRPIKEAALSSADLVSTLFDVIGPSWAIKLPSPFISYYTCSRCGKRGLVGKPSFKCLDIDFACNACNSSETITLSSVDEVDIGESDLMRRKLSDLGIPPFGVLVGTTATEITLFELTSDIFQ